ncbi:MAG: septum formation family protein [Microbacterium sp.]
MNSSTRARMAAAGALVLATALLGGCSALDGILGGSVTRDAQTQEVTEAGDADVFTLRVGDCFNDVDATEVTEVPAVPCADAHDNEVYLSFDMPDGEWPGQEAIDAAAEAECTPAFSSFVGLDYDSSSLDWYAIYPVQGGWEDLGDREILCAVWDPAGMIEGTLAGAAR